MVTPVDNRTARVVVGSGLAPTVAEPLVSVSGVAAAIVEVVARPPAKTVGGGATPGPANTDPQLAAIEGVWQGMAGRVEVARLAGNGGRPVVVFIPVGLDPNRPVRMQLYLHGHGWNVGAALRSHRALGRVGELAASDPQTIFVLPQAGKTPFSYWLRQPRESLARLEEAALQRAAARLNAASLTVSERIVDAHSGAGRALVNAIDSGELRADKVNLLDAGYGDWAQRVATWARARDRAGASVRVESWYTLHAQQKQHNRDAHAIAPALVTLHQVTDTSHNGIPARFLGTR